MPGHSGGRMDTVRVHPAARWCGDARQRATPVAGEEPRDPSPTGMYHLTLISPRSANPLEAGVVAKLTFDPCTQLNSEISSGTYA